MKPHGETDLVGSDAGADWWIYKGSGLPIDGDIAQLIPPPPPWRTFSGEPLQAASPPPADELDRRLGKPSQGYERRPDQYECDMVNSAILLRRPLLVTGNPGTGKSSLAYRISRELRLGRVLHWPITSRTTLRAGLYDYDAIGRAQAAATQRATAAADGLREPNIGDFVRLGPLGTALLAYEIPRVLLIDELDKSDIDLPNDLLHIFEDGEFVIPELVRSRSQHPEVSIFTDDPDRVATVVDGRVRCRAFPVVVITSNGEREFPPAFLRRCLRLEIAAPNADELAAMVLAHLPDTGDELRTLIDAFLHASETSTLARDQLLNAVFLSTSGAYHGAQPALRELLRSIWHPLATDS
jgi:MoxR-like ATPase